MDPNKVARITVRHQHYENKKRVVKTLSITDPPTVVELIRLLEPGDPAQLTSDWRYADQDRLRFYDSRGHKVEECLVISLTGYIPTRSFVLTISTSYIPDRPGFYQKMMSLLGSAG